MIKSLFEDNNIIKVAYESTDIAMAKWLKNNLGYKIFIYAAGNYGRIVGKYLEDVIKLDYDFYIDKEPKTKRMNDKPVYGRDYFDYNNGKYIAFVSTKAVNNYRDSIEIYNFFDEINVELVINIMPLIDNLIKEPFYTYIVQNKNEFINSYNIFKDDVSKETFYYYIKGILTGEGYKGPVFEEEDKYFKAGNINFINIDDDFVWINCGSAAGDTIFNFLNNYSNFKKIYAVEGDRNNCIKLEKYISFLPNDIGKKISIVKKFVGIENHDIKIDDIVESEKVSLINMDIEGAEIDAINSAKEIIKRDRPVLSICVYHKQDDLIKIPKLIGDIVDGYVFFLRKYPSDPGWFYNGIYKLNELVLYAIPEEIKII